MNLRTSFLLWIAAGVFSGALGEDKAALSRLLTDLQPGMVIDVPDGMHTLNGHLTSEIRTVRLQQHLGRLRPPSDGPGDAGQIVVKTSHFSRNRLIRSKTLKTPLVVAGLMHGFTTSDNTACDAGAKPDSSWRAWFQWENETPNVESPKRLTD